MSRKLKSLALGLAAILVSGPGLAQEGARAACRKPVQLFQARTKKRWFTRRVQGTTASATPAAMTSLSVTTRAP